MRRSHHRFKRRFRIFGHRTLSGGAAGPAVSIFINSPLKITLKYTYEQLCDRYFRVVHQRLAYDQSVECQYPCCSQEDMVMDRFDFSPLFRSTIGFDRLTRLVDAATSVDSASLASPLTTSRRPAKTPTG